MTDVSGLRNALFESKDEKEIEYLFLLIEGIEKGAYFPRVAYKSGAAANKLSPKALAALGEAVGGRWPDPAKKGTDWVQVRGKVYWIQKTPRKRSYSSRYGAKIVDLEQEDTKMQKTSSPTVKPTTTAPVTPRKQARVPKESPVVDAPVLALPADLSLSDAEDEHGCGKRMCHSYPYNADAVDESVLMYFQKYHSDKLTYK